MKSQLATPQPCNYAEGRWVPSNRPPLYNSTTCTAINNGQNCIANGRLDTGYLYHRWQPKHCNLPAFFDPIAFLNTTSNMHLAFVGDSLARNQLESLVCLLSSASEPELVEDHHITTLNRFRRWNFRSHNVTISVFWSPFLVNGTEKSLELNLNTMYVDSAADTRWAAEIDKIDVVVFSIGHWFLLPAVYYERGQMVGCHVCPNGSGHLQIRFFDMFRRIIRNSLAEVGRVSAVSEKLVVAAAFQPAHFEGEWDQFGACSRTEPYKEGEKEMGYVEAEMRKVLVEEVAMAAERGGGRVRFEVMDVTRMAMMRPDGHPGAYMNRNPFADGVKERVQNDCVHWCLPGPIDAWNEIFLEIVKTWKRTT